MLRLGIQSLGVVPVGMMGTGALGMSFLDRLLGIDPSNLLALWPLDELAGIVADNAEGTAARDGAYTGVTLGQSQLPFVCPFFDGANDYVDIYSASLDAAFDGAEGTLIVFSKVTNVGVWTDSTRRYMVHLYENANNEIRIQKTPVNNTMSFYYDAGGVVLTVTKSPISDIGWMSYALTWSASANEMKAYYNGVQEGATQVGLGVWAGGIGSLTSNCIGANTTGPANVWDGWEAYCGIWKTPLSPTQIANIHTWSGT